MVLKLEGGGDCVKKLTKSVEIEASPEKVFAFIIDEKKMNDAMKGWAESELTSEGPVGVGTTLHFVGVSGETQAEWDMEVIEFVKNKKMEMRTRGATPFKMTRSFALELTAKGTKLTYSGDYEVPNYIRGKLVDKRTVRGDIEKHNTKMLENIKKALES